MSNQVPHTYEVHINWNEGRKGTMRSPALDQTIEVATPPEFEGGVEGIWSPEHLFTASVSSCFMTTFLAIAEFSKLSFENISVNSIGKLDKIEGKFIMSEILLQPELMIANKHESGKALRIMEKAEKACLISRSIKTEVIFKPKVFIGTLS